jgi:hypothetical protein
MLGKKRKLINDPKTDKFLLKLYEILNNEEYNKIIHWSKNGSYIVITNIHILTKKILPIYFNHQNYSSFVRQLNMYNFHKIRTNPNKNEQYFIHESFNKAKTLKEIKSFKRKTKDNDKNLKCLFFEDEDSKIKYTILEKNKIEKNKLYEKIDLIENDEKKMESFQNIIKEGNIDFDIQQKMLLFLLNKSKENIDKQNEYKIKLNELNEQKYNYNSQIQNWNNEIENQSMFLKKIKNLYIFLVNLLMRYNNNNARIENKINITNNEINKNKGGKKKLVDFIHRYIDYHEKNRIGFSPIINNKINNNKIINNKKIISHKNNIVQKGETFSINKDNFNFDDYFNKIELISFKSMKSGKLNDSFSFSAEDKNFNSSFSMIGNNNNLFNLNNTSFNVNQNILSDQNLITHNYNNYNNNNINNSSFGLNY